MSNKSLSGTVELDGAGVSQSRSMILRSLMLGFAQYLPPMEFYVNPQDSTVRILGAELRAKLRENKGEWG